MVYKTKGIILNKIMHTDNKIIVQIFTYEFGPKSYMLHFSLRKDKKKQLATLLPLAIVEITADQKQSFSLEYIKEIQLIHTCNPYTFDIIKASVNQFLNEILCKILWQCASDKQLFTFIEDALFQFNNKEFIPDFHLRFLLHLTQYLGCCPENNYSEKYGSFNCHTARFDDLACQSLEEVETNLWLHVLLNQGLFPEKPQLIVPYAIRNRILTLILTYYTEHVTNLSELKSQEILHTVLRN